MAIPPVPVTERTVALYATFLARRLKPSSTRQYLNIVRLLHLESGLPHPFQNSWLVQSTLKGIERVKGREVTRKAPITPQLLLTIKGQLNLQQPLDSVFWAACLIMFFGLLRKSNLFGDGRGNFDPRKQLTRDCFLIDKATNTLSIRLQWAKNNQFRERVQIINLHTLDPHPLCPVKAIIQCFRSKGQAGPRSQAFPITSQSFCKRLESLLPGSNVSSHSFRRGGATWALAAGVPGEIIKAMGDWQSGAYLTYLDQIPQPTIDFYRRQFARALPR